MRFFPRRAKAKREALMRLVNDQGRPQFEMMTQLHKELRLVQLNVKAFGYELARRLADELPIRSLTSAPAAALPCKASVQSDFGSEWLAHWAAELKIPVVLHRKVWELAYVLQAIHAHGSLRAGARGLGFACGQEPIASYLASQQVYVTATDLALEQTKTRGWTRTNQHLSGLDQAFLPHLVDRALFDQQVRFEPVDMNAIPSHLRDYDFCWSICAVEHLGSIDRGLVFLRTSLDTLRPGGLAVHTLELNVDGEGPTIDNWVTVLFQRRHIAALADALIKQGHEVAAFDWNLGEQPMDRFVDLPPWLHDLPPLYTAQLGEARHLKLGIDGFVATCFGLVIRKGA